MVVLIYGISQMLSSTIGLLLGSGAWIILLKFVVTVVAIAGCHWVWRRAINEEERRQKYESDKREYKPRHTDFNNPLNPQNSFHQINGIALLAVFVTLFALLFVSVMWSYTPSKPPVQQEQPIDYPLLSR